MAAQQKLRVNIPRGYSPSQRDELGRLIIKLIKERTHNLSLDKSNTAFGGYSKDYKEEKGSSKVNLTGTGDMLDNIKVLKTYSNYITIGYEKGYDGMGKVEGNRKGTYGAKKQIAPKRDFLGIQEQDVNDIIKSYGRAPNEERARQEQSISDEASNLTEQQLARLEELGIITS